MAKREGLSLNHFITLAVAEKIVRMESRQVKNPLQSEAQQEPRSTQKKFLAS